MAAGGAGGGGFSGFNIYFRFFSVFFSDFFSGVAKKGIKQLVLGASWLTIYLAQGFFGPKCTECIFSFIISMMIGCKRFFTMIHDHQVDREKKCISVCHCVCLCVCAFFWVMLTCLTKH